MPRRQEIPSPTSPEAYCARAADPFGDVLHAARSPSFARHRPEPVVVECVRDDAEVDSPRPEFDDPAGDGRDRPVAQGAPLLRTFLQRRGGEAVARGRVAELNSGVDSREFERDFDQVGVRLGFLFGDRLVRLQPRPIRVGKVDRSNLDAAVKQGFDDGGIA